MGEIKHVQQECGLSCGVACLAMVLGKTFKDVIGQVTQLPVPQNQIHKVLVENDIEPLYPHDDSLLPDKVYIATVPSLNKSGVGHYVVIDTRGETIELHDPNYGVEGKDVYDISVIQSWGRLIIVNEELPSDVLISKARVAMGVQRVASEIDKKFYGQTHNLLLICVLKGAYIFTADLSREIETKHDIDFVQVKSYTGTARGEFSFKKMPDTDIRGKDVIVVEDVVDSGYTAKWLYEYLSKESPKSLSLCTLLGKNVIQPRDINVSEMYDNYFEAFSIDDHFVIGYGLDYNEDFRDLPYIGIYQEG